MVRPRSGKMEGFSGSLSPRGFRQQAESLTVLRKKAKAGAVTLLFAAHDEEHNNAVVLKSVLTRRTR